MKTTITLRLAALGMALARALPAHAADDASLVAWRGRDVRWSPFAAVKGAAQAPLWAGADATGQGALFRLPINLPWLREAATRDTRLIVLLGAVSVEIAGRELGEFGPGSYLAIPGGAKHALTATAAGECTFAVLESPAAGGAGAAAVAWRGREVRWAELASVKGGREAALWSGAGATGQGTLLRLPINLPLAREAQPRATRLLVLTGAISVEIAGQDRGEFGPGAFVVIPRGAKHVLTATAAGECTFLIAQDGAP